MIANSSSSCTSWATAWRSCFSDPWSTVIGRRNVILLSLGGYVAASGLSVFASSFSPCFSSPEVSKGMATAATRVAIIASLCRDQVSGRRMAEVMSLAITIFMAAPILAPSFGQLVSLQRRPGAASFVVLVALWRCPWDFGPCCACRKRCRKNRRIALNPDADCIAAYGDFVSNRTSMGYTLVSALCASERFSASFPPPSSFSSRRSPSASCSRSHFAFVAGSLACATLANARLVGRFGMRRLTHGAVARLRGGEHRDSPRRSSR